ncbi:MAG: guanylate kinase, partial [bacterium]
VRMGDRVKKTRKGLLIVLSSPSGGGKTTLAGRLLTKDKNILRSVSCTTRKPRAGEREGRDYFFLPRARFQKMRDAGAFLEWAPVHGQFYGTPKSWVGAQQDRGKDVLLVIDVQGGRSIRRLDPRALLIFLEPPSLKILGERLTNRQSEDKASLRLRLKAARAEMRAGKAYPHRVVNDRLGQAVQEVFQIIRRERKKKVLKA